MYKRQALGHSEGAVEKADRDRLLGALDLSHRTVDEIMRHRRQIEMINADTPPAAIISQMLASPHSRLPVYRGEEENIVGAVSYTHLDVYKRQEIYTHVLDEHLKELVLTHHPLVRRKGSD